jgi:thioesterase domain-containing protein
VSGSPEASDAAAGVGRAEVERYLHDHIPISSAMGVRVVSCDSAGVRLGAPLAANINHRATVFGGSASAVAILAAWTYLHVSLRGSGLATRLVIQRNTIDYLAPITADFEAECPAVAAEELARLVKMLRRHGKARITLSAQLTCAGTKVAAFSGEYVAVRLAPTGN